VRQQKFQISSCITISYTAVFVLGRAGNNNGGSPAKVEGKNKEIFL
jgi:hypothetical protein